MKQPPRSAKFDLITMSRVDFLNAVHRRLVDDVGNILILVDKFNSESILQGKRLIGFWAILRMILPIIEAVSHVQGVRPQELLGKDLHIRTPYLAWDLFRHSLIHGDYLQHGVYKGKTVSWAVGFNSGGHVINSGHIGIDLSTLYEDLVKYLSSEISKNDKTIANIEVGVKYGSTSKSPEQGIIDDFAKL